MCGVQKTRVQTLNTLELRQKVWQHISETAKKKDLFIDFVNGHSEHCHCLVSLVVDQTISKVRQLIKGELAFWFNKQGLTKQKLEWHEYFAVSVSGSQLDTVRNFIKNQEEHLRIKHFKTNMMNLLLDMDLRNLLINLAEANK